VLTIGALMTAVGGKGSDKDSGDGESDGTGDSGNGEAGNCGRGGISPI